MNDEVLQISFPSSDAVKLFLLDSPCLYALWGNRRGYLDRRKDLI